MSALFEVFALPFARIALAAGLLVGGMCSFLGVHVVLRRVVFLGIALAQLATLGAALSFYLPLPPTVLALLTTLAGALFLSNPPGGRWVGRDAMTGFVYSSSTALSILLVAKSAQGESHVLGLLFGNILTLRESDLILLAIVCVVVIAVHLAFAKQFLFAGFDPETARTAGFEVRRWNALFDLTLAVAIATALYAAGALLVFSFLVQPALLGLAMGRRMPQVTMWAVASALIATLAGVTLSVLADLPTGPTVTVSSSVLLVLALLFRRIRPLPA